MTCDNKTVCTCTYPSCSRHGKCCECISYHRSRGEAPGCLFSKEAEKTYDRSFDMLCRDKQRQKR